MRIAVLVLDGVFDVGLACMLDTFTLANAFSPVPPFDVQRIGVRKRVKTGQGLTIPLDPIPRKRPDLLVVPALGAKSPGALDAALEQPDATDACAMLREWSGSGTRLAAACTATFLVAHAGLLDGRAATTTWWLAPAFRARFPEVDLDPSKMLVETPEIVSAGAALAHLDLALWLVRRHSPELARTTARHLAFDRRPEQSAYEVPGYLAHADTLVEKFEAWARAHLADFSLARAARAVGASERTLERRVHRALGRSPLAFVQDLRVDHARHQLETTDRGIDEIANSVGYEDGVTLRTLLRRKTGLGLRELRGPR